MGKFIVVVVFALTCCYFTRHFFPGTMNHAFMVGNFSVNWMALLALGYLFGGYKLVSK